MQSKHTEGTWKVSTLNEFMLIDDGVRPVNSKKNLKNIMALSIELMQQMKSFANWNHEPGAKRDVYDYDKYLSVIKKFRIQLHYNDIQ